MSPRLARPLSLGNIMSAGVTLYRSHLKSYFGMSAKAHLWALIPIYGWAKFETLKSAISRHAFQELIQEPETLKASQEKLRPKLWSFWAIQILINFILFAVQTALNTGLQLLAIPFSVVFEDPTNASLSLALSLMLALMSLGAFLVYIIIYLWIITRFFIPELPFAIEDGIDLIQAIGRSWKLTGGKKVWQIIVIISVISIIVLPLYVLVTIPPISIFIPIAGTAIDNPSSGLTVAISGLLLFFAWLLLLMLVGMCIMPLWQSIKAAIYYDIRTRKEGLGLTLNESSNISDRPT